METTLMRKEYSGEQELILALRNGRSPAFRLLYTDYGPRLYGFCKRSGLSPEDAREIVQETFIRVWEHRQDIRTDTSFSSYLFTIARNLIYNSLRRTAYWEKYLRDTGVRQAAGTFTHLPADERELQRLIGEAIRQLPDKCRQIFRKSRYEGCSNQQIAEEMAISKSTVENQLNKALRSIRVFLEKNGYGPTSLTASAGLWYILINFASKQIF
jgi:RNA polymerase sigma-70 factor (ECF subfamily)